ncbi:MAG: bifunctional adenosylcobinamide kinase/adenosylcobinamide-phosphate guanylyltransferase [Chlorobi bacterium]|nr:bifunctional adenosylcobinamide kinase/adenosylcobinamide-phosphate guanylyltransferase [Chlorobiota bacterium]
MANIILITGGARSGKSGFAMKMAKQTSSRPVYLATARVWDDDFKERINRHKRERGGEWINIEEEKNLDKLILSGRTVVLDCITLWLTNIFHDNNYDMEKSLSEAKMIWNTFVKSDFTIFVVSNEIGMGVHAADDAARKFTDLQGFFNQFIAAMAEDVYLMVSGIPVKIK